MATQEYITSNAVPPEEQQAVKEWRHTPWNEVVQFAVEHIVLKNHAYDAFDAMHFAEQYLSYALQDNETPPETRAHHIIADVATLSVAEKILERPSLRRKQRLRAQAAVMGMVEQVNKRIAGADAAEQPFLLRVATDTRDITALYINEGRPKPEDNNFSYVSQEMRIRSRSLQRDFPGQYSVVKRLQQ